MKYFLSFILFVTVLAVSLADNWAILVAGSNGYWNYRHQADVCHAYHILRKNGIPDKHIIVMMYDDIAYNKDNPKSGSMINEPGGPNVYPGVPKDYTGHEVTPENFMKILKNEDMGPHKKTFKTGPNDNIFIYFTDHGGPGIIAFPHHNLLHAKDLISTLEHMYNHKLYNKLVFYMEACESGSMFNGLLKDNLNIYAETASNPYQSSYACYYDRTYRTYLADCYSINWMNHTEFHDVYSTTLNQQFKDVHKLTTKSPVCLYGDKSMGSMLLAKFQAAAAFAKSKQRRKSTWTTANPNPLSSRDAKLNYFQRRVAETNDHNKRQEYIKQLEEYEKHINAMDVAWNSFKGMMNLNKVENSDQCYGKNVEADCVKETANYAKTIGLVSEYSLKYLKYLNQACQAGYSTNQIQSTLRKISKEF